MWRKKSSINTTKAQRWQAWMSKINRQWPPNIEAIESRLLSDHRANEATLLANVISTLDQSDFDHEKTFVGDLINSLQPKAHWIQDLLVAYDLTTEEGLSLMCMAEALMRLPDKSTRDALLQDGTQQLRRLLMHLP